MLRLNESEPNNTETTKAFIENNWSKALMLAGAAGMVGAAVWLTARYLRFSKKRTEIEDRNLRLVENEVELGSDETSVILETGTYLGDISGEEGRKALIDLAKNMDDEQAIEALKTLREVLNVTKKK
ncbi:MAG: hypothetical protein UX02_C0009G0002 [Candidatus Moranbacteria bacterium GW2011_GWC1_45_18]|uniref:Uncharacterized protein n=1 Tax=Candidatus Collierbacteria bacterium GW2011_GWB1_44_6 TaxID=1618384 RepID=A0A0G1JLT3_9BACT|nr:MAG: hypothetical protein UW68_C0040G0007 [Candidatus Collierbacteria bacterium GW2011_GWB1_44_6]KKT98970.1 MAG: hypothetical protein UX02_C0009G0002 [Candidatus Moranbacteria bacterium GW2011_GWC1_45_18]